MNYIGISLERIFLSDIAISQGKEFCCLTFLGLIDIINQLQFSYREHVIVLI
jgi:hypothetical protein